MYDLIQIQASRNFIYFILLFSLIGHREWFLWLGEGRFPYFRANAFYRSTPEPKT